LTLSVGGHRYSDPDVLSLIKSRRGLVDPRAEVIRRAKKLNQELRSLGDIPEPRNRIEILASLAGITVLPMSDQPTHAQNREGLLFRNAGGHARAFYDPSLSDGRVNFTIAHEIVHTFFPNSVNGARFRNAHIDQSREATELERLCHLGASELLMPEEEFVKERGDEFGLIDVPRLAGRFGSSYEATVYRLATSYDGFALAGRLTYRLRLSEQRRLREAGQPDLFRSDESTNADLKPKYRRQSLHYSPACGSRHLIPWNKSFDEGSHIYKAREPEAIGRANERLPNQSNQMGLLECVRAPYQDSSSDPNFPDVLFFWKV